MWLTKGEKPKRDAFFDFFNNKLTSEIEGELHYQFIKKLEKEGLITLKPCILMVQKLKQMPIAIPLFGVAVLTITSQDFLIKSMTCIANTISSLKIMIMQKNTIFL